MAKEGQTIRWPKRDRQYDGQRGTDNTIAKEGQTIRWPKRDRQYDGQRGTDNTMAKGNNGKNKNNDLKNTTQKFYDWATRTSQKIPVNSDA
jgi:hypothetical protein